MKEVEGSAERMIELPCYAVHSVLIFSSASKMTFRLLKLTAA